MENAQFFYPQWICNGEEKTPKDLAIKSPWMEYFASRDSSETGGETLP